MIKKKNTGLSKHCRKNSAEESVHFRKTAGNQQKYQNIRSVCLSFGLSKELNNFIENYQDTNTELLWQNQAQLNHSHLAPPPWILHSHRTASSSQLANTTHRYLQTHGYTYTSNNPRAPAIVLLTQVTGSDATAAPARQHHAGTNYCRSLQLLKHLSANTLAALERSPGSVVTFCWVQWKTLLKTD